jgi:hypothetical protein
VRVIPGAMVSMGDHLRPPTILDADAIDREIRAGEREREQPDQGNEGGRGTVSENPATPAPAVPEPAGPAGNTESETVTGEDVPSPAPVRTITVQDLIDMSVAGLSDDTLIVMIKASRMEADSPDGALHRLRAAGLGDRVLAAVRARLRARD